MARGAKPEDVKPEETEETAPAEAVTPDADPKADEAPKEKIDPDSPHEHDFVEEFEFLPSCNCRVPIQICTICYFKL